MSSSSQTMKQTNKNAIFFSFFFFLKIVPFSFQKPQQIQEQVDLLEIWKHGKTNSILRVAAWKNKHTHRSLTFSYQKNYLDLKKNCQKILKTLLKYVKHDMKKWDCPLSWKKDCNFGKIIKNS